MRIAVVSGKGGTGKSTFSLLFSLYLSKEKGKKVCLVDLDIECPNLFVLLNQKLNRKIKEIYLEYPKIEEELCKKCYLCAKTCTRNAIFYIPGDTPKILYDLCDGCLACYYICKNNAIKLEKRLVGSIFFNKIGDNMDLITFYLEDIKFTETGKVIRKGLKEIERLLENYDYVVFDCSSGLHCSVLVPIVNSDVIIIVSEDSPMGLQAKEKLIEILSKFKKKYILIVNKYVGLNKNYDLKIPYSEEIQKLYSRRKVEELYNHFRKLKIFDKIFELISK